MIGWEDYGSSLEARLEAQEVPMESLLLNGHRVLFVDNYAISRQDNLRRELHQPVKHEGNPVLRPEKPWEQAVTWATCVRDEEERCFKAWYLAGINLAYATSPHGVDWEKPSLGLTEWEGSRDNNLLLTGRSIVSPSIVKDPFEENPDRRYKLFGKLNHPVFGMYVAFSSDGLRWNFLEEPVITSKNDPGINDRPTMMQDLALKRFIAFTKREMVNPFGQGDWGFIHRCRCVSFSRDFEKWTDPLLMLHPDDQDPSDLQIYGLVGFNYEGMYLGLMDMFWSRDAGPNERTLDTQLALSRDGETWWRAGDRKTFLPVGPAGSWDQYIAAPNNCPPVLMGNELWFFYRGRGSGRHGGAAPPHRRREPWQAPGHEEDEPREEGTPGSGMGLARLRRDGFVSIDAGPQPGYLLTRPLVPEGSELHLNACAAGGRIRAALFAAEHVQTRYPGQNWTIGKPLPGCGFEDCQAIREDTTNSILTWRGNGFPERLSGKPAVIRFELVLSSFFSFWFE